MRGCCAPLVCDDKVGRTFCNFCSLLRRVLRGVARTLAWMCILFGSVLRGHQKSLVNYSVLCKLNCRECPFLTAPSNFPILPLIILLGWRTLIFQASSASVRPFFRHPRQADLSLPFLPFLLPPSLLVLSFSRGTGRERATS